MVARRISFKTKAVAMKSREIIKLAKPLSEKAKSSLKAVAKKSSIWINTLLATEFVEGMEQWFTKFNINKDIYDSAIDSVYNQTHIGGSLYHHLYDGQHTILGAWKAAVNALPDDTHFRAIVDGTEHLVRDICSKSGINPFFGLTKGQHEGLAAVTHLPKSWLADMITFNAAELLGAAIASLALVFGWTKGESKRFAEYAGALGISTIISANPLLGLIVIISAARAYALSKKEDVIEDSNHKLLKHALKGAVTPSIVISVSVIIGGPVYVGLILGIIIAILVRNKMDDEQFKQKIKVFLNGYHQDFIKPKAHLLGNTIKDTYVSSHKKIRELKIPRVKVQISHYL